MATDLDKQKNDTMLFPGKMTIEEAQKLPPTVMITAEFDYFRRDAYQFADKLRQARKLVGFGDYSGVPHNFMFLYSDNKTDKKHYRPVVGQFY